MKRARRKRRPIRKLLIFLLVISVIVVGAWFYLDFSLNRINALADYPGRPPQTAGSNWLLVGSDSRGNLTDQQMRQLAAGDAGGNRSDTTMLLHIPNNDTMPTLVSLLRDSYVNIPGHGKDKLDAAYTFGGAALLARTVEQATGLRVDHYLEIGFGGLVNVVDDVGGVRMCVPRPMVDPLAGLDLAAGCQTLNGAQSLGYLRTRATARADLDRVDHQRAFLSALLAKVASPTVYANPLLLFPLLVDLPKAVTVDRGDHLIDLTGLALTMHGAGGGGLTTTTVPISGATTVAGAGDVVLWDANKTALLFGSLRTDSPVPAEVAASQ